MHSTKSHNLPSKALYQQTARLVVASPQRFSLEYLDVSWRFRPYGKKRGRRRTGSRQVGRLGEAFLSLLFLAGGSIALYQMLFSLILPEWRASRHLVEQSCHVIGGRVLTERSEDEAFVRYRVELQMRFQIDGQTYEPWGYEIKINRVYFDTAEEAQQIVDRFPADTERTYTCWIDPNNPEVAVLVRRGRWWLWLLLLLPGSFVVIGGGGVIYTLLHSSTSAERRAALAKKAADLDLFEETPAGSSAYPHIPSSTQVTDSPGTELAYRLPINASRGWRLFGILLLVVFWNGFSWAALIVALNVDAGEDRVWLLVGIAPFVLIGLGILVMFVRQWMLVTGVGATRIEVSAHPLFPGSTYSLFLSQTGRLHVHSLEVLLMCEEEAIYEQGTDIRIATESVYQESIYRRQGFDVLPGVPFEDRFTVSIPPQAMHSFKSPHNEVRWSLLVRGDVARWPDYERSFPIVVYPLGGGSPTNDPARSRGDSP